MRVRLFRWRGLRRWAVPKSQCHSRVKSIPSAPGDAGEASMVRRPRSQHLFLIGRDGLPGPADLPLQIGERFLRLSWAGNLANDESRSFEVLQRLAMFPELGPVPGNVAIAVCGHVRLSRIVRSIMATGEAIWRHASGGGARPSGFAAKLGEKARPDLGSCWR